MVITELGDSSITKYTKYFNKVKDNLNFHCIVCGEKAELRHDSDARPVKYRFIKSGYYNNDYAVYIYYQCSNCKNVIKFLLGEYVPKSDLKYYRHVFRALKIKRMWR